MYPVMFSDLRRKRPVTHVKNRDQYCLYKPEVER